MKIYLAGKVRKNCWRHGVVRDLRGAGLSEAVGHTCNNGYDESDLAEMSKSLSFPVLPGSIFGQHDYTGPYFIGCDHGCWHRPDGHGVAGFSGRDIVGMCLAAVMRADLVFAWVDALDCFGTVAELGFARGHHKEIVIAGPERYRDMWFLYTLADRTFFGVPTPADALRHAIDTAGKRDDGDVVQGEVWGE